MATNILFKHCKLAKLYKRVNIRMVSVQNYRNIWLRLDQVTGKPRFHFSNDMKEN
jgi:hypothetical protein